MDKMSVVINVVNEEIETLPRALASISNLADEIVIVDMTEEGELREVASKFPVKVYQHERVPYVEIARNFGISKATKDWILVLDPDEEIPDSLARKIKKIINCRVSYDYYSISRKNIIFGKWMKHSRWWPDHNIRFFKKGSVSWNEVIHTVPMTKGEGNDLQAKEKYAIIHHHYNSIEQYIERMNRYTTAQAKNLLTDGYVFNWQDMIKKPSNEFLSRYFQGEGYKDGLHGLAMAGLQGLSELVVILKIWQNYKFKKETVKTDEVFTVFKKSQKDMNYWMADKNVKTK